MKNRNITSKMKRSKVTDYAALKEGICLSNQFAANFIKINQEIKKLLPLFILWKPPYLCVYDVIAS